MIIKKYRICQIDRKSGFKQSIWFTGTKGQIPSGWKIDHLEQQDAPIIGLSASLFWFYSSYNAQQWGTLLLNIFCSCAWALGIYNSWFRPIPQKDQK